MTPSVVAVAGRRPVRKAIIPAAGFGTRFLPVAKAVPKELLPILGRPVISFVVAEAVAAGCDEICIILRSGKEAIERLFDPDPALEAKLVASGRSEDLELLRGVTRGASIRYVYQHEPRGLGDAVLHGRVFAGADPFLVLAGDTIIEPEVAPLLVAAYEAGGTSAVAVELVPEERVSRYGIVAPSGAVHAAAGRFPSEVGFPVSSLVEKPRPEAAPSRYAVSARYLFTPALWPFLERTAPGRGGEIQLTDAMDELARSGSTAGGMCAVPIPGRRYDLGNPTDFLAAEIEFARRTLTSDELVSVGLST